MSVSSNSAPNFELLFSLACDFVQLSSAQQWGMGVKLGVIDAYDGLNLEPDELEILIFRKIYQKKMYSDFAIELNNVRFK